MTVSQAFRGSRLGLPESGPGSLAPVSPRLLAFCVDAIASALVAAGFVATFAHGGDAASQLPRTWSLIPLAVDYVIGMLVAGRTLGMYLCGLRVIRIDRSARVGAVRPVQAVVRTVLLILLIPALIWDRDGRGMHDRFAGTAVVRS